jgi:hypothetical protein
MIIQDKCTPWRNYKKMSNMTNFSFLTYGFGGVFSDEMGGDGNWFGVIQDYVF